MEDVRSTRIFGRRAADGRQVLVYANTVSATSEVAMVLPLPVEVRRRDVQFVDLSAYPSLFDDLFDGFDRTKFWGREAGPSQPLSLPVAQVGAFEVSVVPNQAEFRRVDRRFGLPEHLWAAHPEYVDHAFVVARLRPGESEYHPLAFWFHSRSERVFFPTLHLHDGTIPAKAEFDHRLYVQGRPYPGRRVSRGPAHQFLDVDAAGGCVDGQQLVYEVEMHGLRENQDSWL